MEHSYRCIASNLNVGLGTVYYTLKRFRDVAKVRRNPGKKCLSHREELLFIGLILENPG